jgi:8-hydroxy-5-deazaflavin:NADPH oxidoreductase
LSGALARRERLVTRRLVTRIGILGAGAVGQALGDGFIALGHDTMIGSRDPRGENVQAWVGRHAGK